jgi:triphosphoribosyl-dephospho-CoA synthase
MPMADVGRASGFLGWYAQLACLWEVTARKPGNVHRFADFDDVNYLDFVTSAAVIAPCFDLVESANQHGLSMGVGEIVWDAISRTRALVQTNTNLGILLLLAPLTLAPLADGLRNGVLKVLRDLTVADAEYVYQAIRLAEPGGLGRVAQQDVSDKPTRTLLEVMSLAAHRDLIARQYVSGFKEVFDEGVSALRRGLTEFGSLENGIIACHLHLLAMNPDTLIARKCGLDLAEEASRRAAVVVAAGWPRSTTGCDAIKEFDAWLRADGHKRNPGATADVVTASLFVALREGIITLPPQMPWSKSPS